MTAHATRSAIPLVVILLFGACAQGAPPTPLAAAARRGDPMDIDRLIATGADVNEPSGRNNWPPLIHAVHKGRRQAVVRLLEYGASLDGNVGRTALFMASGYGDADTVALLLSRGVPTPDSVTEAGELIAAAIGGAWDIDYQWSGCDRHTAVATLLVARDSDLRVVGILSPSSFARVKSTLQYRVARWYARRKGCDELLRIVDFSPPSAPRLDRDGMRATPAPSTRLPPRW